jgi:hypothetical protein
VLGLPLGAARSARSLGSSSFRRRALAAAAAAGSTRDGVSKAPIPQVCSNLPPVPGGPEPGLSQASLSQVHCAECWSGQGQGIRQRPPPAWTGPHIAARCSPVAASASTKSKATVFIIETQRAIWALENEENGDLGFRCLCYKCLRARRYRCPACTPPPGCMRPLRGRWLPGPSPSSLQQRRRTI